MSRRDEDYVIDLCDFVLQLKAKRHHKFDFLIGDPGKNGRCAKLPVDAYYEELNLVIEYQEKQHTEAVAFFDRRPGRREQRRRYDQRRRDVLAEQKICLVELGYDLFQHNSTKRLKRNRVSDEVRVRERLDAFLPEK
jgi:hypothetical protein